MAAFTGTLNTNEFYAGLFNAFKYIITYACQLDGLDDSLVVKFRADGGLYRDKSVWTAVDIATSREWDPTDTNVLATEQKADPKQQQIVVDQKRQIAMTFDHYLSKRAWMDENTFNQFNAVVQSIVEDTKKVYDQRLVDVAVGTMEAAMPSGKGSGQAQTVAIKSTDSEDLRVRKVGKKIANILADLKDTTRDYNDYGFMQSYNKDQLMIVWNINYLNEFNYVDLPVIFHKDGIINFVSDQLPGRYFGRAITADDIGSGKVIGTDGAYDSTKGTLHLARELTYNNVHYFAGDKLSPSGSYVAVVGGLEASDVYLEDPSIICKIMHKDSIKYLSGFETSTEFVNPKNHTSNRYLTWMYAKPDYLRNFPLITLREVSGD